jgi:hypothetical protein
MTLALLISKKESGNNCHIQGCSPVSIDGRRKAKMAHNDQPIADRDENGKAEEYGSGAPISLEEERQDYKTRKDVANSLDPHEGKGGGIVNWDAKGSGCTHRVEYKVDANSDDSRRYQQGAPEE